MGNTGKYTVENLLQICGTTMNQAVKILNGKTGWVGDIKYTKFL